MSAAAKLEKERKQAEVIRLREDEGWRSGRPVEDPEKTKRWGYVTAKPSEFLVHVRNGRVLEQSSGQGATCFKWPNDAVAIVPTSLQQLSFRADQVTAEKVGIEVVGLAVYRIADPLLAYRVLNFSYPERAQEKLEQTLTQMFVGATRRLVANLAVDDCLQKRKAALASELLREIAPVVGGSGHPHDRTQAGWGVVIDTIEIQEVRVLSEKVFAAMQAPYRASLDKRAREAKAQADAEIAQREAVYQRETALARMESERASARAKLELEKEQAEQRAALARQKASEEARLAAQQRELRAQELEAALAAHELEMQALARRGELAQARRTEEAAARRQELELVTSEGHARAQLAMAEAEVLGKRAEAEARRLSAENLPALAQGLGGKIGELNISQFGGAAANPFDGLVQAVSAVLELARRA